MGSALPVMSFFSPIGALLKTKSFQKSIALASGVLFFVNTAHAEIPEKEFDSAMQRFLGTESGREQIGKAVDTFFKDFQRKQVEKERIAGEQEREKYFKDPMKVEVGKSPVKGPTGAKITIFEFSDFQCPFCRKGADTAEQVLKEYPNDVKLVFKNLPLPFHKEAKPAAIAAAAANNQGKFWEFHNELFANQNSLGADFYKATAKKLNLDMAKFEKDIGSEEIATMIDDEAAIAQKLGFQGTPGFVVGGVPLKGAYPVSEFKTIISKLLGKK
jgi:protein-disulfide isomerase